MRKVFKPRHKESFVFIKKMVRNPRAVGTLFPSSKNLGELISQQIALPQNQYIVEVGAGTGSLTQSMLDAGVSAQQLLVVEIDRELSEILQQKFPQLQVLNGSADALVHLVPPEWQGQVGVIVSSIPLMNMTFKEKQKILQAYLKIMRPDGKIIQFTYAPISPLPAKRLGLKQKRLGYVLKNFPPAFLWQFHR